MSADKTPKTEGRDAPAPDEIPVPWPSVSTNGGAAYGVAKPVPSVKRGPVRVPPLA